MSVTTPTIKGQRVLGFELLNADDTLITSNCVLIESFALIQSRLGMEAAKGFQEDVLPLINIEFVDSGMHRAGVSALMSSLRRKLSLVDCVSFEVMRTAGIKAVFAFDPHFKEQGFRVIP